jgi:hypothetical protein
MLRVKDRGQEMTAAPVNCRDAHAALSPRIRCETARAPAGGMIAAAPPFCLCLDPSRDQKWRRYVSPS